MRFLMMIKHSEDLKKLPKELSDAIARLSQSESPPAVLASGALAETAASSRVRIADGKLNVTDGPFTETKEVVGGFAIMEFKSKEEAVQSAREYMELYRKYWPEWKGETEVRQIYGPEEITFETGRMELRAELKHDKK
ncbi:MAG TPA: YciI family protein [Dongiaceae bacterium]|nr:YciI family protein [Dongiaceae bacterium]